MAIRRAIHLLILSSSFTLGYAQLQPLGFRPISWSGSKGLDRIIMISASPDLVHIYDPATSSDITVALPKTPLSLGVTPDGMHAAVGHDGVLSWIDLASASIIKTFTISGQAKNVILSDSSAWFFITGNGYTGGLGGLDLSSGTAITGPGLSFYYATSGVLDATQTALYLSQDDVGPNDMEKVTITSGQLGTSHTWPYHGDYPDCGPYYLSADGSRIYTSCGTVVHASSDTKLDMNYVRTLPVASFPITGLADSAGLKKVAAIPSAYQYSYPPNPNADTQVQLFNTDYLTPAGTVSLLPFVIPSGSFPAHGKGVFFSKDDTRLFVVVQADSTSNLSNSFGVEVLNLANPLPCTVQLGATVLNVDGAGSLGSLAISATPDCFHTATSSVDWIVLASGAFGSGNGTVQWIVRPNYGAQSRTGTITINGQTYTVQQGAGLPEPLTLQRLSFNVVDAAYSTAMDRIVAVSISPDELHIYDPGMGVDSVVPLIMPALAVSVAPDGLHAAVGHDGWISYIDLQARAVLQVFQIVTDVHHVLLAGNGYIYAFPQRDWSDIYSLAIDTGVVTNTSAIYEGRIPRLEPNGKYFYLSGSGWFSKWDITKGVAVSIENNPGGGFGGNYWMYQDGSQLISANGKVYATSDVPAQDVKYTGTYPNVSNISWAANTTTLQSTAIIPVVQGTGPTGPTTTASTQVQFYGDAYLGYTGSLPLPEFSAGGKTYPGDGLFAFWNSTASVLYVVERADPASMLPSTDAIYTINPSAPPSGCAAAPLGPLSTISPTGGFGGTVVMAGAGCAWSATSDSSWLVINAGGIGAGTANVAWSAAPNTGAARSAKLTIGGHGYTVTQLAAGTPQLTISQTTLAFSATWPATDTIAAQTFTVTSGTGPFTVAANPSWISVAMTGSNTFSVSVSPSGLAAGANVGAVTVTSSDGQIQAVIVTLTISPNFVISPASITFQYTVGDPAPSATLSLADGSSSGTPFTAYAQGYVTVTPASGTLPATLQVTANLTFAGTYTSNISIYTGGKNYTVPVKLVVTGVPVSLAAITSDADFTPGPVSPGALVVVWGSGLGPVTLTSFTPTPTGAIPPRLAGTTVTFDNYAAPVIYTSKGSVCVIVPYEVAGLSSANVVVSYNGSASAPFTQALAATAPHFFTTTYMPAGQIVGLNSDYSVNSANNPAPAGSVVVLYATGEGVTSPPGVDGTPVGSNLTQPLANVVVMIGGQQAQLLYAGGAPGIVEGVLQVNARIPAGTASGNIPVSLQIGSAATPAGGTIAVK